MRWVIVSVFCLFLPIASFAMADRMPPVYGIPTLYGEYELSSDDVRRAAKNYGNVPVCMHPAPIVANAGHRMPAVKHPIKPKVAKAKKVSHKKVAAKKKTKQMPVEKIIVKNAVDTSVPDVALFPVEAKVASVPPMPSDAALGIADNLNYKYDIESYCTQRVAKTGAPLPDGIILMSGRPDLMSCTSKK